MRCKWCKTFGTDGRNRGTGDGRDGSCNLHSRSSMRGSDGFGDWARGYSGVNARSMSMGKHDHY